MKKFTAVMLAGVLLAAFSPVFANGANEGGGGREGYFNDGLLAYR